jgi:hypothetical protein
MLIQRPVFCFMNRARNADPRSARGGWGGWKEGGTDQRKTPIIHLFALLIETLMHTYERIMIQSTCMNTSLSTQWVSHQKSVSREFTALFALTRIDVGQMQTKILS